MMVGSAVAVFALGLRHGADPVHLAAIDNLTRNSVEHRPLLSRFVGTLFAGGHSVMVLSIAALVGLLGTRFASHSATIELIGTWLSIAVLILIAAMNLRQLASGPATRLAGVRTRLLPAALREGTSPLLAVPIGLLFGFGFETSSQVAAYALAFGTENGVAGAVLVGATFCLGMICTDTLDSVLVHRLVSQPDGRSAMRARRVVRVWIWSVTLIAMAVAAYEFAQVLGWRSPVPDLVVSASLVAALLCVFVYVFIATRRDAAEGAVACASGAQTGETMP
jgi:nickel/cobalt transporter (NiCoT) family protein